MLREDWQKLSDFEKQSYKPDKNTIEAVTGKNTVETAPSSSNVGSADVAVTRQQMIEKCGECGRMFLTKESLRKHKDDVHGSDSLTNVVEMPAVVDLTEPGTKKVRYFAFEITRCTVPSYVFMSLIFLFC